MRKKKAKAKVRTWKMKGWVGVPTEELRNLQGCDFAMACQRGRCAATKEHLFYLMQREHIDLEQYTLIRLGITATTRA